MTTARAREFDEGRRCAGRDRGSVRKRKVSEAREFRQVLESLRSQHFCCAKRCQYEQRTLEVNDCFGASLKSLALCCVSALGCNFALPSD